MDTVALIGYIAATLTTIAFLPQVIKVVVEKRTRDISRNMYIVMSFGVAFWLSYGFLKNDFPIMFANGITFVLTTAILWFKIRSNE